MENSQKQNISPKMTAALAMLVAISIILGKYLAFSVGDVLRFSLENLPIIFAGLAFGPLQALLVAVTADLIGCLLVGFVVNPLVTLGAAAIGLVSGFVPILLKKYTKISDVALIIITVVLSHFCGSVLIKTFGLAVFYDMPIFILMLWRLLNYVIVSALEALLLCILLKREGVRRQIEKIKQKSK
ncbi:MAG: folate family ECF transporter S component [Ruminococcaceae bacterium]|nr:folate family ECF transporter S component [Oscillospiraceae bacterium]